MLDASNFDPRPLRIRIVEALSWPEYISTEDIAKRLGDPHYTVSSMMSKLYLYGGPVERITAPSRGNKYVYRRKLKKDHP